MNDTDCYPLYELTYGRLIKLHCKKFRSGWQYHHYIEKTHRKNNPKEYAKFEHLQKLILIPANLNYSISNMCEKRFNKLWGLDKKEVIFDWKNRNNEKI